MTLRIHELPQFARELVAHHAFARINAANHEVLVSIFPSEYALLSPDSIKHAYCDVRRQFLDDAYNLCADLHQSVHHLILIGWSTLLSTKNHTHPAMTFLRQYLCMLLSLSEKHKKKIRMCIIDLPPHIQPTEVPYLILQHRSKQVEVIKSIHACHSNSDVAGLDL